jgi:hypothetical protein
MCDAYIDDNPKDVEAYLKSRGRLVMLFDRPWNRHVSANPLVTLIRRIQCVQHENYQHRTLERLELCQRPIRVTNWDEIVMAIQWFDELLRQEVE